nr:unnamed protein product [Callosobruchus chinensis]
MHGNLSVLRQIISELRYGLPNGISRNEPALQYILGQYRKYKVTDEQLCKAREEMEYMAKSYLCYLKSSRLEKEIQQEFHGKGERSVQDTARMVGFKLPHDPKKILPFTFVGSTFAITRKIPAISEFEIHILDPLISGSEAIIREQEMYGDEQ